MWLFLFIFALAAAIGIHFFWQRKFSNRQRQAQIEIADLQRRPQQTTIDAGTPQQVFNSMLEGLLLLDRDRKIYLANRAFKNLFGLKTDLRGKTVMEVLRLNELAELVGRVETEKQVFDYELKLPGLNERWLQVNAALTSNSAGEREGTILVFHDLTRLKQLERTREEFVANVSHELRTPLSMIKGYVETLLDGAKDEPQTTEKFLRIVDRHVDRLAFLIEDLLTISKLESGRIILNRESVPLNSIAQNTFDELRDRAAARQIKLTSELKHEIAWADRARLQQVFFNLLDNAIKYGREGGEVLVRARTICQNKVEVQVKNDGAGIPAAAIDRIFERFYRVDKARSREEGGTGLGLAIVKHIILAHGGRVWAESEPNRGAIFFFTLPVSAEAQNVPPQTGPA
ncbi:MAG TPA: ATP-binding protein [Verrucomicrobiae bacterium]